VPGLGNGEAFTIVASRQAQVAKLKLRSSKVIQVFYHLWMSFAVESAMHGKHLLVGIRRITPRTSL